MSLMRFYACSRVGAAEAEQCTHCGVSFRRSKHSAVQTLFLLAVACALALPIVNNLYTH